MNRAAIYTRVSTAGQEAGYSLDTQQQSCSAYAASMGFQVVATFRETFSGITYFDRPSMSELRRMIREGQIEHAIFHVVDRASRGGIYAAMLHAEAVEHGVTLHEASGSGAVAMNSIGEILMYLKGWAGEGEHAQIRERTNRGRRARAESGKPLVGPRPLYGYRWVSEITASGKLRKVRLEPDPSTAPVVRRIFTLAADGMAQRAIARTLTEDGIPTPTGLAVWSLSSVNKILVHPFYGGDAAAYRWQETQAVEGGKKVTRTRPRPAAEQVALPAEAAPALVDPGQWAAVQERAAQNQRTAARNNRHPEATLLRGGYAVCGYCGRTMQTCTDNGKPAYRCGGWGGLEVRCPGPYIAAHVLDAAVWDKVDHIRRDPDILYQRAKQLIGAKPDEADLRAVEGALATITGKQTKLAKHLAVIDDDDVAAPLHDELRRLAADARRLGEERDELAGRRAGWEQALASFDFWVGLAGQVLDEADAVDYAGKRAVLGRFGVRVRVFKAGDVAHPERFVLETVLEYTEGGGVVNPEGIASPTELAPERNRLVLTWSADDLAA